MRHDLLKHNENELTPHGEGLERGSILSLCREPERGFLGTLRKQQQLCRSCQGCVPSTIGTILTFPTGKEKSPNEGPIPAFPKGKVCATTSSNTRRTNSRPLGRVREGLTISYFFTANGGLFLRPKAAF